MQIDNYSENLKQALQNLIKINESIYGSCIDISMQGDLKEWNNAVPIGEIHRFSFELFKNSSDTNILLLVKLMESVDETYETIKNLNAIKVEEE